MDILDFKKRLRSRVEIKPKWTWRRIKEDGTIIEATRGNTTDPFLASYLGNSWTGATGTNANLEWPGKIEVRNSSGAAIFESNIFNVSSPIGGPYTALSAWPAGGEFLGHVPRNKSPNASGAIYRIVLTAGTIDVSITNPVNWSVTSGGRTITMPGTKRLAELWEFHISVDIYMDGVKSVRMWDLLAGQLGPSDNKHFAINTGGSELQVSRGGNTATVAKADSISNSTNNREVTSRWTIDGSQLSALNLGTSEQVVDLKPTFGKNPAEAFYGNDTTVVTNLTNSSVKELEVITTFGTSYTVRLEPIPNINIPAGQTVGTSAVEVVHGKAPFSFWIISHDNADGSIQVGVTNDGGGFATAKAELTGGPRPADGLYNVVVGVRDDDGNTASETFDINVGGIIE